MKTEPRILVVAGPPGVGKTSVAALLSKKLHALHVQADQLWPDWGSSTPKPWQEKGRHLVHCIIRAASEACAAAAAEGVPAILDFAISPWHLQEIRELCAERKLSCHYIVLRADSSVVLKRAGRRRALSEAEKKVVSMMIEEFGNLAELESHAIDTTELTPQRVVASVLRQLNRGRWSL